MRCGSVGAIPRRRPAGWRKSRYSNPSGNCVEVAPVPGGHVAVRDSRNRSGPALVFTRADWEGFLRRLRRHGAG